MKTIVIGIAGGSGSGKPTLAHKLKDALGDDIGHIVTEYARGQKVKGKFAVLVYYSVAGVGAALKTDDNIAVLA